MPTTPEGVGRDGTDLGLVGGNSVVACSGAWTGGAPVGDQAVNGAVFFLV